MFRWFKRLVTPYPEAPPVAPPQGFFAFMWACSEGLRPYLIGMTLCTAVIGAFEALLFAMLGGIVDWLAATEPAQLWTEHRGTLLLLGGILASSALLVALQTILHHAPRPRSPHSLQEDGRVEAVDRSRVGCAAVPTR